MNAGFRDKMRNTTDLRKTTNICNSAAIAFIIQPAHAKKQENRP